MIRASDSDWDVRKFLSLVDHLHQSRHEFRTGYAHPLLAAEIEKEIISREAPESAAGVGLDMTPAVRLLRKYEEQKPVFTQAERNLLLSYAFYIGGHCWIEEAAQSMAAHTFREPEIVEACQKIEQAQMDCCGLSTLDGIESQKAQWPTSRFDFNGCESPVKVYEPYALYLTDELPADSLLLWNGMVLQRSEAGDGWWDSGLRKIDQTYTAPHHWKRAEDGCFQIADIEYQELFNSYELEYDNRGGLQYG